MKQILENFKTGECLVEDVPDPVVRPGTILVRNAFSIVSSGTEGGTINLGKMSLVGKARARPEQAMKVIQVARTQGVMTAYNAAQRALEMPIALGYCCAGEVIEVSPDVSDFAVGDLVACGGAGFANHAEIVCVPKNLAVRVPDGLALRSAAFTTLGSIALQSVRVGECRLGENVAVIGLGLVGLLTAQILRAAGCRVFGIDVDPRRIEFVAKHYGIEAALVSDSNLVERVKSFSGGHGADAVIITAATEDNKPVALGGEIARAKGKVVVVGRTRMEAPRDTFLFKELELRTSMAYGPGQGDPDYEERGVDYPYAFVRWTENRNMQAFIELLADKRVDADELVTHEFEVGKAQKAFDLLTGAVEEPYTAIALRYPRPASTAPLRRIQLHSPRPARSGEPGVSVIGAGSYATNEFLPLLAQQKIRLCGIASATGVRAKALATKYGFSSCASDSEEILKDDSSDCVFILTRHDSHADLTVAALRAGKHVFVEKPLAMNKTELERVTAAQAETGRYVMVGYNRRYAPLATELRAFFGVRAQPASLYYCANVGYRPPAHWLHDPVQGGGVLIGEACHHIDFCNWFTGSRVTSVTTRMLTSQGDEFIDADNFHVMLGYADGSVATVAYLSNGAKAYSAERVEIFCDNKVATLSDYRQLEMMHKLSTRRRRLKLGADKGHRLQIEAFLNAVRGGDGAGFDSMSYIESAAVTLRAAEQLRPGDRPEPGQAAGQATNQANGLAADSHHE